jgi:hypothetical protein
MTTDLTKITTPFGLLDPETQVLLRSHGGPYEHFNSHGQWVTCDPFWQKSIAYRVKQKSKPSIDWSHVSPEYKWLAQNPSGTPFLFVSKPVPGIDHWVTGGSAVVAKTFASYKPGTCDWKDSLVERE